MEISELPDFMVDFADNYIGLTNDAMRNIYVQYQNDLIKVLML